MIDEELDLYRKRVPINEAKYVVFINYGPDMYMRGYANVEDAQEELNNLEADDMIHYLAEIKGSKHSGAMEDDDY